MDALLDHMIVEHGYRRIAFIAGPPANAEAQARLACYRAALDRHGIAFDPDLVEPGYFARRGGQPAIKTVLARAGKPEAVVAANDGMALGAMTALRAQGDRVPRDIAVTGFDDLIIARLGNPPLTTVRQPNASMVNLAVDLVLAQMGGSAAPELSSLTTEFVARESCGCRPGFRTRTTTSAVRSWRSDREQVAQRAVELQGTMGGRNSDILRLLSGIEREFRGAADAFTQTLEKILSEAGPSNDRHQALQSTISALRGEFLDVATPELEDVWDQARTLIAVTNGREMEQLRLDQDEAYHRLLENAERFGTALDLPTLKPALSSALVTLGLDNAYVSRYIDADERELECFAAVRDGAPYQPENPCFPADELLPTGLFPRDRRGTFLLFPLAFHEQKLGIALFESRPGVGGYAAIRDQISAVLRSIALHQEIVQQTTLHERRVQEQERQATAKRIQSLSVLAGGVAHDLNNVLGPLVALPDLIVEQLDQFQVGIGKPGSEVRGDIETIKAAALRASQTIKDLLTLGRQGRTPKEPLSLNETLARCLSEAVLPLTRDTPQLTLELSTEPLYVLASEPHIVRAVTNLVHNALEAVEGHGRVVVQTASAVLREPTAGYETIDPGNYALIIVADTGRGISQQDLGRIFEPFFSGKRLSDNAGSGLGLAIVHGVVKEHGGFVNIESTVSKGTTFTLYLPRIAEAKAFSSVSGEIPRGSGRILVVDDEPVQLRTCRRVLTNLGYRVDALSSGREAYQLFLRAKSGSADHGPGESPYDVVILDMLLNEEDDGVTLFNKIQAVFPGQKAIIATGHAPTQRLQLAVEQGLTWLAKPYTRTALARAVHAVLPAPLREPSRPCSQSPPPSSNRAPSARPTFATASK